MYVVVVWPTERTIFSVICRGPGSLWGRWQGQGTLPDIWKPSAGRARADGSYRCVTVSLDFVVVRHVVASSTVGINTGQFSPVMQHFVETRRAGSGQVRPMRTIVPRLSQTRRLQERRELGERNLRLLASVCSNMKPNNNENLNWMRDVDHLTEWNRSVVSQFPTL